MTISPPSGQRSIRVGIDVGGTNTDAVAIDDADRLLAWVKTPTTRRVADGIEKALVAVLGKLGDDAARVGQVLLGTTHGINAILERRNLCRVAAIRLGAPATTSIPPLISWPSDLRDAVLVDSAALPGGNYFEGRSITPLDPARIREFVERNADELDAVAITGVFSPAYRDHELEAAEVVRAALGSSVPISLSHEIGSLGLLQRENATVLNAALFRVAQEIITSLDEILDRRGIRASTFFAQNDGTLMGGDLALRYPVLTIGSGPANSVRGAAFLTGVTNAIVADVGGTSTDLGVLIDGFPRESAHGSELAGISTNFRMPDLMSVGIGGGTIIAGDSFEPTVGPGSVGYRIKDAALAFGGDTPTLTDAAVANGRVRIGNHTIPPQYKDMLERALAISDERLSDAVESVNLAQGSAALIVVGGGGFLVDDRQPGIHSVLRPDNAAVANAVGVAASPVSARWDTIIPHSSDRQQAIDDACDIAKDRAVLAGADPRAVEIIEISEVPVGYLTQPATRLRVRAAGRLGALA